MSKAATTDLYESSVQAIRQLKQTLGLRSTQAVLAHLLDELAEHPATSAPTAPPVTLKTINQSLDVATNQRLQLLRSATRAKRPEDVVAWLLDCYHERHAPPASEPGKEMFVAILAYLERQRKRKRADAKAAKEARQ
jgi:hypothetical protein